MERITPLAKILAEANGIEWEKLTGTGEGGTIVEQDILQYLSRIMSGEEEPPSTPVDAPPPDWTGEDLPGGGMFDAAMLKGAGVDADIAAFVEQTRPAMPVSPVTSAAPQVPASLVPQPFGADEFELDDAPIASQPTPFQSIPVPPMPAPSAAAGLGSLLSKLYKGDQSADLPEVAAPPVAAPQVSAPQLSAPQVAAPEIAVPEIAVPPVAASALTSPAPVAPAAPEIRVPPVMAPAAPTQPAEASVPAFTPTPATPAAPASPAPAAPAPAVPAPAASNVPRDATWYGVYLRRDANVRAAAELAAQLGEALEQDVPLALLVTRAAQRHAGLLNLESVALDGGHQGARTVRGSHLREVLGGLDTGFDGTPDLLVIDAAAHDLDDLHYPHTLTLSVGRLRDGRVSLSLCGQTDTAQAAQFLAQVAATLEKPIVLVL